MARDPAAGTDTAPGPDTAGEEAPDLGLEHGDAQAVDAQVVDAQAVDEQAVDEPAADGAAPAPEPAWCRMSFGLIEVNLPDTNPVVVLQEADLPYRQLRITIGQAEGVAIAYAWRGIPTPKPLTHELVAEMMRSYGLSLEVVRITEVRGASFSAELVMNGRPGQRVLSCRPSDAIALALRQPIAVPIMAAAEVMEQAATSQH